MKKIRYTFHSISALLMLLFISMPSCLTEDVPTAEEGKGIVLVSLNNTQLRAGDLYADDALIQKVRILVFLNGRIEKNELFVSGEDEFVNPFTIEVLAGAKEVHVVANETSGLTPQLAAVSSVNALKGLLSETINAPLTLPFVMTGETSSVLVSKTDPHTNTTVTLERIAARIKLQFKKETDAEVKITKVSLLRNAGKSSLIPGGTTIADQSYWNHELSGLAISLGTGLVSCQFDNVLYLS